MYREEGRNGNTWKPCPLGIRRPPATVVSTAGGPNHGAFMLVMEILF